MNAILICFSCEPGKGSEPGVGWMWTKAAAEIADVTLITTSYGRPAIEAEIAASGARIDPLYIDAPAWVRLLFRRKLIFVYYTIWQAMAARTVRRLEARMPVDVAHHVTWASDSLPSAILKSHAPVRIWGPVGGSTTTARPLYQFLSPRGKLDQVVRDVVNGVIRRFSGERVARHATLIVALNHDVEARWAKSGAPIVVEPNMALAPGELDLPAGAPDGQPRDGVGRRALFVGRLIPWKGLLLALEALRHAPGWQLEVMGEGPERQRGQQLVGELGLADRVTFRGYVPRADVLEGFRTADALLFPSFHDSAPWAVGEASSLGCPVVCLDAGGPALLGGSNAHVVPIEPGDTLPQRLGACLSGLPPRGARDDRWGAGRLPGLLAGWYGATTVAPPNGPATVEPSTEPAS